MSEETNQTVPAISQPDTLPAREQSLGDTQGQPTGEALKAIEDRAWAKARREYESKVEVERTARLDAEKRLKAQEKPTTPTPTKAEPAAPVSSDDTEVRLQLTETISDLGLRVTKEQRQTLLKLARIDKPTDMEEWVKTQAKTFGWGQATATTPAQAEGVPPVIGAPARPPSPAPAGGPTPPPLSIERYPADMKQWTKEMSFRFVEEHGGGQKGIDALKARARAYNPAF